MILDTVLPRALSIARPLLLQCQGMVLTVLLLAERLLRRAASSDLSVLRSQPNKKEALRCLMEPGSASPLTINKYVSSMDRRSNTAL